MPSIEDAIMLATESHRGQTDLAGMPFILHPLRVMAGFFGWEDGDARMVAVLHDVIEDSDVTAAKLFDLGYPRNVIVALGAISRKKDERYGDYIKRVAANPLAVRVKIADLNDNLDTSRASTKELSPDEVYRYRAAHSYLWGLPVRQAAEDSLRNL
jgi:GTP diphosphokinase / guanosine-3',5'-bis(diphosphate) 3'-diphosphatase